MKGPILLAEKCSRNMIIITLVSFGLMWCNNRRVELLGEIFHNLQWLSVKRKNKVFRVLERIKSRHKFNVYILAMIVCVSQEALLWQLSGLISNKEKYTEKLDCRSHLWTVDHSELSNCSVCSRQCVKLAAVNSKPLFVLRHCFNHFFPA